MEALSAAKEFLSYIDHQDLRYLNTQTKMNQRHMKWVEFLQSYTFVMKHKLGKSNKVVDMLSWRFELLLRTVIVQLTWLESMKADYEVDKDFGK